MIAILEKIADFMRQFDGVSLRDTDGSWFLSKENIFDRFVFFFTKKRNTNEIKEDSIILPSFEIPDDDIII